MTLHSRYIKGNLAYWDTHRRRLIDAIGPDVVKYVDDFVHLPVDDTTGDPTAWDMTVVEVGAGSSTAASADAVGGALLITSAGNENDGANLQLKGESFELTSDQVLYFGTKLQINDVTQTDLFIGLAITDTAILGGVTDRIGFESLDGSTDLKFAVEKDSTETLSASIHTLVDATDVLLEFYFDGTNLEVFVDGSSVATPAVTNLPDDEELRVSVHFLTGEAVANTCQIDWIRAIQIGR